MPPTVTQNEGDGKSPTAPKKKYLRTLYLANSTPCPNWVMDDLILDTGVPHAAIRVLLFLLRRTVGWNNKHEEISLRQIEQGAGVTRPTAIHCVRLIVDCWGLFHKTRGRLGQHSSVFTIADLSSEAFNERAILLSNIYRTVAPTPKQLRDLKCTTELLNAERAKMKAEDEQWEAAHR